MRIHRRYNIPLTKTGKEVLGKMQDQYGTEEGKRIFYSSINAGKKGSSKWHHKGSVLGKGKKKK